LVIAPFQAGEQINIPFPPFLSSERFPQRFAHADEEAKRKFEAFGVDDPRFPCPQPARRSATRTPLWQSRRRRSDDPPETRLQVARQSPFLYYRALFFCFPRDGILRLLKKPPPKLSGLRSARAAFPSFSSWADLFSRSTLFACFPAATPQTPSVFLDRPSFGLSTSLFLSLKPLPVLPRPGAFSSF